MQSIRLALSLLVVLGVASASPAYAGRKKLPLRADYKIRYRPGSLRVATTQAVPGLYGAIARRLKNTRLGRYELKTVKNGTRAESSLLVDGQVQKKVVLRRDQDDGTLVIESVHEPVDDIDWIDQEALAEHEIPAMVDGRGIPATLLLGLVAAGALEVQEGAVPRIQMEAPFLQARLTLAGEYYSWRKNKPRAPLPRDVRMAEAYKHTRTFNLMASLGEQLGHEVSVAGARFRSADGSFAEGHGDVDMAAVGEVFDVDRQKLQLRNSTTAILDGHAGFFNNAKAFSQVLRLKVPRYVVPEIGLRKVD